MGFSTIYLRPFKFDKPLTPDHAEILIEFSETEHEDESGKPGGDGKPPTYYCQWIPTEDLGGLEWDKGEKFYYGKEWLVYLIETFIKPWGYMLNGENPWYIDDFQEAGILKVVDNADGSQISLYYAEIKIVKTTGEYHAIPRTSPRRTS